jgi:hypothetical protein
MATPSPSSITAGFAGDADALDAIAADGDGSVSQRDVWKHVRKARAGRTVL